jgi:hypothetical protein
MKTGKFTISDYATMAGIFILKNTEVNADIVYHDINPDTTITNNHGIYELDIDNDGDIDFKFENNYDSFGGFYTSSGSYEILSIRQRIFIRPYEGASIAGSKSNTYSFSDFYYFPFAIGLNESIDSSIQFQNDWSQKLAYRTAFVAWSHPVNEGGNWYPEKTDHFIGVGFKDESSFTHFGWIRCDVKDEGRILIIKDYAFETEIEHHIAAGDTVSYVGLNEAGNSLDATVYSFNRNIYIYSHQFDDAEIIISDMSGRKIIQHNMQNENEIIILPEESSGIYIVTLIKENLRFVRKVILM